MKRAQRLRRARDFDSVYSSGRSWSNPLLAIRVTPGAGAVSRFGFAVGKRVGNAVARNRVKRRLRAATRAMRPVGGWDVVIVARPAAADADFDQLGGALRSLFGRARLREAAIPTRTVAALAEDPVPRANQPAAATESSLDAEVLRNLQ